MMLDVSTERNPDSPALAVDPPRPLDENSRSPLAGAAMRTTWTFHTAGQLYFGPNATQHLNEVAVGLGIKRLLLVTDAVLVRAGLVDPILGPLSEAGVAVELFSGGEPEPSLRAAY